MMQICDDTACGAASMSAICEDFSSVKRLTEEKRQSFALSGCMMELLCRFVDEQAEVEEP
jgi:hypothetical protein